MAHYLIICKDAPESNLANHDLQLASPHPTYKDLLDKLNTITSSLNSSIFSVALLPSPLSSSSELPSLH